MEWLFIHKVVAKVSRQIIETEHGIFNNNEVTGQTAEEVYQEWLENKDKPPQPNEKERIEALEQAMLEMIIGGM